MITTIENDQLRIAIQAHGAELDSIYHKEHQLEYLWSGDSAYWGKKSPVLFPIVGTLKDNTYTFKGEKYSLSRHGFARDRVFELEYQTADSAVFLLKSDAESFKNYPFHFEFRLHYALKINELCVTYGVKNLSDEPMYFSVGGHPAFQVPLVAGTFYEDYFIQLNETETFGRYPLSKEGLIETMPNAFLNNSNNIVLKHSLFYEDAIVLKHIKSNSMAILSDKTPHGLRMTFDGFPYFGIWAAKNAPFICLEPWCGIADMVNTTQELTEKEGINQLEIGEQFERTWRLEVF